MSQIDVRIPQHFTNSHTVHSWDSAPAGILETAVALRKDAQQVFRSGEVRGSLNLCTAKHFDLATGTMVKGPPFFAIEVHFDDLQRWEPVHEAVRGLIKVYFEDLNLFQYSAIRWFRLVEPTDF